jgi:hypothetical protein
MLTRIIFNGQEYNGVEAMPPEVRQAYEKALAQFADADRNGIPDILERGAAGNVIGIQQSSITVNGRRFDSVDEMPAPVRFLFEQAMEQSGASKKLADGPVRPPGDGGSLATLGGIERTLTAFLQVLLGFVAVAILAGAVFLMWVMDAGSRSQGGRFYVALGAVVLLGLVDTQFARLMRRQFLWDSTPYRRYRLLSLLFLALAAAGLLGLALFLP